MGEHTNISWCDHSWNPWIGCTKVSPGCQHCYAETLMEKRWNKVQWGPLGERKRTSEANWQEPLRWQGKAAADSINPRRKVFCASLADVFEDRRADCGGHDLDIWRLDLWALIRQTPNLDWLLLTKRPQNVQAMVPDAWVCPTWIDGRNVDRWPRNVWLGTSVENQEYADKRIPELLKTPAPFRFLSIEPMLGPVDLTPWIDRLQWVIVGGESGSNARPMHPDWVRSLRDQCVASGVPFFFKQWGEWYPDRKRIYRHAQEMIFGDTVVHRLGKKAAGNVLDDQVWHEFPEPAA